MLIDGNNQLILFPEIPDYIEKARGPVVDSVMMAAVTEMGSVLIDDTSESSNKPLPIQTRVLVSYEEIDVDIAGGKRFTAFDREVIDAIASLAKENRVFTAAMVYRVMMGKKDYQFVTKRQERLVEESMRKCSCLRVQLDVTDIMERNSPIGKQLKQAGVSGRFGGSMLSFETLTLQKGKRNVTCFRLLAEPLIFRYAETMKKVSSFPIELLDTPVNKNESNIILQSFLLRSIDAMYRGESDCFIDANQMYHSIPGQSDLKQQRSRYRAVASTILDDWVAKGFIKGHSIYKVGGVIKGFRITLCDHCACTFPPPSLPSSPQ